MNKYKFVVVSNNDDISFFYKYNNIIIYNMGFPIDNINNIEISPSYTYVYAYLYHIIKNCVILIMILFFVMLILLVINLSLILLLNRKKNLSI